MITKSFDNITKEIITPDDTISQWEKELARSFQIDTFIISFSHKLVDLLYEKGITEELGDLKIGSAAYENPVYRVKNSNVGVVLSGIGAPSAAAIMEELFTLFKCRNYIVFGSCGALVDIPKSKIIVPTEAYRDEGVSYHYAGAADYITVKNATKLAGILDELGVDHLEGKTWTTDAFYRETTGNRDKRVREGCICVEMECSGLQAVCDFRGLQLYQFVYAADSLNDSWSRRILGKMEMDSRLKYFYLALEIARRI